MLSGMNASSERRDSPVVHLPPALAIRKCNGVRPHASSFLGWRGSREPHSLERGPQVLALRESS